MKLIMKLSGIISHFRELLFLKSIRSSFLH
jgi:hypothetical protein